MIHQGRIGLMPSLAALVLVNLIPLFGVLFLGWRAFDILMLFWAENLVIGAMNILRMATLLVTRQAFGAIFLIPFFLVHYGMFCLVHGVFLVFLFSGGGIASGIPDLDDIPSILLSLQYLALPVAALAASHFVSFVTNFVWAGEYEHVMLEDLMHAPYKRIIIMQLTIILGAFAVLSIGEPLFALVLLVVIKTVVDARAHIAEHTALQATQSRG